MKQEAWRPTRNYQPILSGPPNPNLVPPTGGSGLDEPIKVETSRGRSLANELNRVKWMLSEEERTKVNEVLDKA
jgi:hypothetical protein